MTLTFKNYGAEVVQQSCKNVILKFNQPSRLVNRSISENKNETTASIIAAIYSLIMLVALFYNRPFLLLVSLAFTSHYLYNNYYQKKQKKTRKEIHDVIMFEYMEGQFRQSKHSRCKITHSMDKLLKYLDGARYTLDICMYVMTNMDLANAVLKLHYRGVKVRIIIDADMAYTQGSSVRRLEKQGIAVRWLKSTRLMHHKFFLIDALSEDVRVTPVVMTGSLNWTNQALYGNWEDVIVTSQYVLVEQYKARFEKLWNEFKPVVATDLKFN